MTTAPLNNQRALVTGAGTGIGQAIAIELARAGATVAVHASPESEGPGKTLAEIALAGSTAVAVTGDFRDVGACVRAVDEAAEQLGGLDILVNNAGLTLREGFSELAERAFDDLVALNVRAQFFCAQTALRHFPSQPAGRIVNISSVHAERGFAGFTAYAATKDAAPFTSRSGPIVETSK